MNVREQQDACEFFNCLVDQVDEGLKALKKPPALSQIFGGMFVDQKIIKVQREVELERGRGREEEEGRRTVKEPGR